MEVVVLYSRLLGSTLGLSGWDLDRLEKRSTSKNSLCDIDTVSGSSNKLSDANEVDASFLLRVRVLDEMELGFSSELGNVGNGNKVVDLLAIVFEVEARVSESGGEVDYRLANFVNLFLARYLWQW